MCVPRMQTETFQVRVFQHVFFFLDTQTNLTSFDMIERFSRYTGHTHTSTCVLKQPTQQPQTH